MIAAHAGRLWLTLVSSLFLPGTSGKTYHAHVSGSFADQNGKALAGVQFVSRVYPGREFTATTDADGKFESSIEWPVAVEDSYFDGTARLFGFAKWQTDATLHPDAELDLGCIRLPPGGALAGRVVSLDGTPLAGAQLRVIDDAQHARPKQFSTRNLRPGIEPFDYGTTGKDGSFRIVGVPHGNYWIIALHPSSWIDASPMVEADIGKDVSVGVIRLEPLPAELRIEGTVLDPNGAPFQGAEVYTFAPMGEPAKIENVRATSDEHGRFTLYLSRKPDEPLDVRVNLERDRFDGDSVDGVEAGERNLILKLGALRDLSLVVHDALGKPVEEYAWGIHVTKGESGDNFGEKSEPRPLGRTVIRVPDHPVEIEINAPGFNRAKAGPYPAGPLPELIEVKLQAPSGVPGVVMNHGAPVADCFVELVAREPDDLHGLLGERPIRLYYGWKGTNARTDSAGRFMIPSDHPHMTYFVRAWKDGVGNGIAGPTMVGGASLTIELGSGGKVQGSVTMPGSGTAEGIALELYRKDKSLSTLESHVGTQFSAKTGPDGRFEFDDLDPGPWLMKLSLSGSLVDRLGWTSKRAADFQKAPWVIRIKAGETTKLDLDITRDDLCRLEGHIRVGDKLQEGYCYLELDGDMPLRLPLGEFARGGSGELSLLTHTPGPYRIVIQAGPGHHQYKIITDLLHLSTGTTNWEKDVSADRWEGEGIRLD